MTDLDGRRRTSPSSAATGLFAAGVTVAVLGNVLVQIPFSASHFRPHLGFMIFDAGVGVVYALCAAAVWWLSPRKAPAVLMLVVSLDWCVGTLGLPLQTEHWSWVVPAGLQGWVDVLGPWLALAYPRGRLGDVFARAVVAAMVVLYAGRSLMRVFLIDAGPWGWCDCVPNPLAIDADPRVVATLHDASGGVHAVLLALALGSVLARWIRSSAPSRRVAFLMPLAFSAFCLVAVVLNLQTLFGFQVAGADTQFLWPSVVASLPLAYASGLVHLRGMRGRVVDLVAAAQGAGEHAAWEGALASAVGDARLRLLWWDDGAGVHRDGDGRMVDPGALDPDLARLPVGDRGRPVALVLHDPALAESRPLLESLTAALRLAAENERLTRDLQDSLRQVQESRARLVEAGDTARRRIERDLHDGSQQRLVSLALSLRMATGQARAGGDAALAGRLEESAEQLAAALAELRELARGIHPAVLSEGGLEPALHELAARSPVPVDLHVDPAAGLPDVVAATVYFTVAEALTNTAKHAGARGCTVRTRTEGDRLVVTVADDGAGGADPHGSGLRGIADRVEAVGGSLRVDSPPGHGTRLTVTVPVPPDRAPGRAGDGHAAPSPAGTGADARHAAPGQRR